MKKSLILACLFLGLGLTAQAQFEAANFQKSFSDYSKNTAATSIIGKKIGYIDYAPGSRTIECETITDGQAISAVNFFIKDPKSFQLSRATANILCTTTGTIVIIYSKNQWEYLFVKADLDATKGVRVFYLNY
ncbi:MAG TPA: hypothetical protein PKZ56_02830 [Candidatus Paceibacterota bacterium]|nr:hypothetical protein [Candidatus Paceibacterota bacterium]